MGRKVVNTIVIFKTGKDGKKLIDHSDVLHLIICCYTDNPMVITGSS